MMAFLWSLSVLAASSPPPLAFKGLDIIECAKAARAGTPCKAQGQANYSTSYTTGDRDGTPRFISTFWFSTIDNMIAFENSPFVYAPKYGGFCAHELSISDVLADASWSRSKLGPPVDLVHAWRLVSNNATGQQNLMLFGDEQRANSFIRGLPASQARADAVWKAWWGDHGSMPPYALDGGPFNSACFVDDARDCSVDPQPLPPKQAPFISPSGARVNVAAVTAVAFAQPKRMPERLVASAITSARQTPHLSSTTIATTPAYDGNGTELVMYLGDPQIGFSGNATEDTARFGLAADAAKGATAVVIAGDLVNIWDNTSQVTHHRALDEVSTCAITDSLLTSALACMMLRDVIAMPAVVPSAPSPLRLAPSRACGPRASHRRSTCTSSQEITTLIARVRPRQLPSPGCATIARHSPRRITTASRCIAPLLHPPTSPLMQLLTVAHRTFPRRPARLTAGHHVRMPSDLRTHTRFPLMHAPIDTRSP